MKPTFYFLAALSLVISQSALTQVGINTTGNDPHPSSGLDVDFTDRGMLIPRMTTEQRNAIPAPVAVGLQIYNLSTGCFDIHTAQGWKQLCPECAVQTPLMASNSPVCAGTAIQLSADAIAGATYNWSGPNGFNSQAQNPEIAVAQISHAGSYSLSVTVDGCTSTPQSIQVVVNSPGAVSAGSNGPICAGSTLILTASSIAGATYEWTGPNGFSASVQNPDIPSVTTAGTGLYEVTPSVEGCAGSASTVLVTVNPSPSSAFIYSPDVPIPGTSVSFTPLVAGSAMSWTFASGNPISSSQETPTASWSTPGDYNVSLTATQGGCSSTTTIPLHIYTQVVYDYTGSEATFTVPAGVSSVILEAYGAQGGTATYGGTNYGLGGLARGTLAVGEGDLLRIRVGQQPNNYIGGYNGGGSSGLSSYGETRGGGGATDIRVIGTGLEHRILVGGGGGSSVVVSMNGGAGGGLEGGSTGNYITVVAADNNGREREEERKAQGVMPAQGPQTVKPGSSARAETEVPYMAVVAVVDTTAAAADRLILAG